MRHNNRVTGPYGIIWRLRAINQLRNALQELQELQDLQVLIWLA